MKDAYKNSVRTIAATGASGSTSGCFMHRDASTVHAFEVGINWLGRSNGQWPTKGVYIPGAVPVSSPQMLQTYHSRSGYGSYKSVYSRPAFCISVGSKWCGSANEWKLVRCSPTGHHRVCFHAVRRIISLRKKGISLRSTRHGTNTQGADSSRPVIDPSLFRVLSKKCRLHFKMTVLRGCDEGIWQAICSGASRMTLRSHQPLRKPSRPVTFRAPSWSLYSVEIVSLGIGHEPPSASDRSKIS